MGFQISPFLISVDGPDGVGKSTFTKVLTSKLRSLLGENKIELIKPSYFTTSIRAAEIGKKLQGAKESLKEYSQEHNSFFLAAMQANYEDVVWPAIETNQTAILDSSEIRALAFMMDNGEPKAVEDTLLRIKSGVLTANLQPNWRIILTAPPEQLWQNLLTKKSLDKGDPHNLQRIQRRINCYEKAVETISALDTDHRTQWLRVGIRHVDFPLSKYFSQVINQQLFIPPFNKVFLCTKVD